MTSTCQYYILSSEFENVLMLEVKGVVTSTVIAGALKGHEKKPCIGQPKTSSTLYAIPYSASLKVLKLLSATGELYFNKQSLICDFFSEIPCYLEIVKKEPSEIYLKGFFQLPHKKIPIEAALLIGGGSSPWFIHESFLRVIHTPLSFKELKQLQKGFLCVSKQEVEEWIKEDPSLISSFNELPALVDQEPLPILKLQDRYGLFANLFLDYGNSRVFAIDSEQSQKTRNLSAERSWEKDLLETDYAIKLSDKARYHCPADKIFKSLIFLLEIGWRILDWKDRDILRFEQIQLEAEALPTAIELKGKVKFAHYETSLEEVKGAFNRREKFIQLNDHQVGLMPESWQLGCVQDLLEEAILDRGSLKISKQAFGLLDFESAGVELVKNRSLERLQEQRHLITIDPIDTLHTRFQGTLRSYQQQGVQWMSFLQSFCFGGILADDMGLGKTVQIIAFLAQNETLPALIIVPTSLLFNWKNELQKFLPDQQFIVHHGSNRLKNTDILAKSSLILTSYATLRQDLSLFKPLVFKTVILDEAQAIKNPDSQTAQSIFHLQAECRLCVTGTPVENHLGELWSLFRFCVPGLLDEYKTFRAELETGQSDMRYFDRIRRKIRPFILRRKKEEVAQDLPERIEQTVWIEMSDSQRSQYETFLSQVRQNLMSKIQAEGAGRYRLEILEAILRLRQLCCHPLLVSSLLETNQDFTDWSKFTQLLTDMQTIQEEGRKAIVYSQFTSMLSLIRKECQSRGWNFVYLDGQTRNREEAVQTFQSDPNTTFFLISLKAGSTGLNLTAADYVLLYDPWWNEAVENQAINRAHRLGRKETVIAKRYLIAETIEEKLGKIKEHKQKLIGEILEDEMTYIHFSTEDLLTLLN